MYIKITSLATLPDYVLLVGFLDESYKEFDLKPLINKYQPFKLLTTEKGLYEKAKIDIGGYGVVWNDGLDISADGLYEKGVPCVHPDDIENISQTLIEEFIVARKNVGGISKAT